MGCCGRPFEADETEGYNRAADEWEPNWVGSGAALALSPLAWAGYLQSTLPTKTDGCELGDDPDYPASGTIRSGYAYWSVDDTAADTDNVVMSGLGYHPPTQFDLSRYWLVPKAKITRTTTP
jgi:hypothetical protein